MQRVAGACSWSWLFISGSHDSAGFALDVLDPRHLHLHGDPAALDTKDGHAILSTEEGSPEGELHAPSGGPADAREQEMRDAGRHSCRGAALLAETVRLVEQRLPRVSPA